MLSIGQPVVELNLLEVSWIDTEAKGILWRNPLLVIQLKVLGEIEHEVLFLAVPDHLSELRDAGCNYTRSCCVKAWLQVIANDQWQSLAVRTGWEAVHLRRQ